MARTQGRSPLLLTLLARFREVDFKEEYIPPDSQGREILGCFHEDTITINPVHFVVKVLLHELLHAAKPQMGEHGIRVLEGKLWKSITEEEVKTIYAEYKRKLEEDS